MKQIQRYTPRLTTSGFGFKYTQMTHDSDGAYVTYESHAEILRDAEAQLEALKAMQKSDFSYHMKPIIDRAFQEAIFVVARHMKSAFEANNETLIAADVGRWMERNMNERAGFATGSLFVGAVEVDFESSRVKIDEALIKAGVVSDRELFQCPTPKSMVVVCTSADEGSGFTAGKKYAIDRNEGSLIRICQDDFVSDLDEDDCWIASRRRNLVTGEFRYFLQGHIKGKRASFEIVE